MSHALRCHRCGASLTALTLPLSRRDECPQCRAELHVCRMCVHYAPQLADACTEDDAPEVRDKDAANFCDYFKPSEKAFRDEERAAQAAAEASLRALFGDPPAEGTAPYADDREVDAAEALFKK